jgi:PAS domain S-box-containing protein
VHSFLEGGGTMGRLMRTFDWSSTPIGPPDHWPQTLQTAVSIMLNSSFPMFIWWGHDKLTYFYNDANVSILGSKHPGALGCCAREILPEMWTAVGPMVDHIFLRHEAVYRRDQLLRMNRHGYDEDAYFTFSGSPIKGADGMTEGLFCVITETTEEVKHRRLLQEYQSQLEAVFQSTRDGIGVFNMDGEMVLLNNALATISGYSDAASMKSKLADFYKTYRLMLPDRTVLPAKDWPLARVMRGDSFSDLELRGKHAGTGQECYFSFSGAPVYDDGGKQTLAVTITRDITNRKQAEEELQESEVRFRNLADTAPMYIAMADESGNAIYFNKPWLEFTGKTLDKMTGVQWLSVLHPEDAPKFERDFGQAFRKQVPINQEYRFRRADGEYRWMLAVGAPRFTPEGRFIGYFGTYTDFHDLRESMRQRAELEHTTEALQEQHAQLVALNQAKDEFISLASHQLRTPATGVKQYLGMLLGDFAGELTADQRELTQHAYDSNERQLSVVTDLLSVAQADAGKIDLHKQDVDLVHLINGILDEQSSKFIDRRQTVTFRHEAAESIARIDKGRMRMVLENLVDNASKYTHEGKKIRVTLTGLTNGKVRIAIKDEGVGISKEDAGNIFNKFIRADNPLSDVVGGSGLGLYLVKKIVELHDGTVRVTSTLGKGSTFTVTLPVR